MANEASRNYQLGLLYFTHLLICADGVTDAKEIDAVEKLMRHEQIPPDLYTTFQHTLVDKKEREIYTLGLDLVSACTKEEKLNIFSTLYRLAEIDGRVHLKEIKMLLYSIRSAGIEFEDVVNYTKLHPSPF